MLQGDLFSETEVKPTPVTVNLKRLAGVRLHILGAVNSALIQAGFRTEANDFLTKSKGLTGETLEQHVKKYVEVRNDT